MARLSDIDDAYGISVHYMFLSKCAMQVMRVWSLPALLSLLAKHDTPRRGTLAGSAQIHVAPIQPIRFLDSGGRVEARVTSASRGKGSYVARVQACG